MNITKRVTIARSQDTHSCIQTKILSDNSEDITDRKNLVLFSLNGPLTQPDKPIDKTTYEFIRHTLKPKCSLGIVTGSDIKKIRKQLGDNFTEDFDYVFPENGSVQYIYGTITRKDSILQHLGEENYQTYINYILEYISKLSLPFKRGNFIELRSGIINISPSGRNCSQIERMSFENYDYINHIREKMINHLKEKFPDYQLQYAIGGQISFDVFPNGWDKTHCLQFVTKENRFREVHFCGNKTMPGGNDYEIFKDLRVVGHKANTPGEMIQRFSKLIDTF